jgi:hypothetical protein
MILAKGIVIKLTDCFVVPPRKDTFFLTETCGFETLGELSKTI